MPEYDTSIRFINRGPIDPSELAAAIDKFDPDLEIGIMHLRNHYNEKEGKPLEKYTKVVLGEEITYGADQSDRDGVRRMRITRDNFYTRLELGIVQKDDPSGEFAEKEQFVIGRGRCPRLTPEEFELARNLIIAVSNPQK